MNVCIARTDEQISLCCDVMRELRPHIDAPSFLTRARLQENEGYQLAYIIENEKDSRAVAVAGFRLGTNLAWGKFLYVDDLVTRSDARSRGYGAALLKWLHEYAKNHECDELHLDSGTHRRDAHRFYEREGMAMTSYHFQTKLSLVSF